MEKKVLELVFSESAYGGIKQAQGVGENYCGSACAVYSTGDPSGEPLTEFGNMLKAEKERYRNAVPLPRNEILWIDAALSFGDIDMALVNEFTKNRKKAYMTLMPESDGSYIGRFEENSRKLMSYARTAGMIRIWAEPTSCGMCAMLYASEILRGTKAEVLAVPLEAAGSYRAWGEVPSYVHGEAVRSSVPISGERIKSMADRWRKLVSENKGLRVYLNGNVISVNDDFYDDIILGYITRMPERAGSAISRMIFDSLNVRAEFILYRIKMMSERGLIEADGESVGYGSIIRRA